MRFGVCAMVTFNCIVFRLKTAIDRVMPPVLEAYEAECQKVLIKK